MTLVALIPKGSAKGERTIQPSMNTMATVEKNLRTAKKKAA
jgi:hypothetical protein